MTRLLCILLLLQTFGKSFPQTDSDELNLERFLNKKYKLEYREERCLDLMQLLGINFFLRHMFMIVKPVMELSRTEDQYTLAFTSYVKDDTYVFRLGEEFDEVTPDGRHVRSVFHQDGNVLTQIQRGEKMTIINREFTEAQVNTTSQVDDLFCVGIYKPYT